MYYIGFLDFAPGEIGYHVKGEMGGLWLHPIRILKNIWFEEAGKKIQPHSCTLTPYSVQADFGHLKCLISFRTSRELRIETNTDNPGKVRLKLDISPASVWLSNNLPVLSISGRIVRARSAFDGLPVGWSMIFSALPDHRDGNILDFSMDGNFHVHIKGSNTSDPGHDLSLNTLYPKIFSANRLICDNRSVSEVYGIAKMNLIQLMSYSPVAGYGITAGHPDFPWYFGIDTLLSLRGMIMAGMHDEVKYSLATLMKHSEGGRIPHEIITSGKIYNAGDLEETAIFPWMFNEYVQWSGDFQFARNYAQNIALAVNYVLDSGMKGRGIMEDAEAGTGIDVDTVSFFTRSLDAVLELEPLIRDAVGGFDFHRIGEIRRDLARTVTEDFWIEERNTFANRIVDGVPMDKGFWTSVVPFYAGIASESQYEKFTAADGGIMEIAGDGGIRVGSQGDIMPMNNGMMAIGAANYRDYKTSQKYFDIIMSSMGTHSPLAFPEIVNNPKGCYLQAWSAAFYAECLMTGLLGISQHGGRLSWKPELSSGILGKKIKVQNCRFRNETVSLEYP